MEKRPKLTESVGKALHEMDQLRSYGETGPMGLTPLGERQAGLMEKMGLAQKKSRSTTTSRSVTDKEGVRHSVSHTDNDRGHSTKVARSGRNEDGTRWEESATYREDEKQSGGGVGRTVGKVGQAGKSAVNGAKKVLGVAEDLVR
jgi:hypothetical protein